MLERERESMYVVCSVQYVACSVWRQYLLASVSIATTTGPWELRIKSGSVMALPGFKPTMSYISRTTSSSCGLAYLWWGSRVG